ncbi:hypothetical protein SEA_OTTAWA_93 [Arthrobacter phage Ottawa]|nr:hypothetical protein SEA_KHARCHO_93 [Arthrobacter phage Kharcho]WIC89325.1 hypothetical protein SEA_OTTAWA_93 [Arthrobacter phage Ottawa]
MSITATIREARNLDLHGARPGAAAVVNRTAKKLEEEHALRLNLQREANAARRIIAQMEQDAAELAKDIELYANHPAIQSSVQQRADSLARYAASLRKALSPGAGE